jgi:hypothetical protein
MFEKWLLRRLFGPKREYLIEEWRQLHNEDPHNPNSSPSTHITMMTKSKGVKWTEHVARTGKRRMLKKFYSENMKGEATEET